MNKIFFNLSRIENTLTMFVKWNVPEDEPSGEIRIVEKTQEFQ